MTSLKLYSRRVTRIGPHDIKLLLKTLVRILSEDHYMYNPGENNSFNISNLSDSALKIFYLAFHKIVTV